MKATASPQDRATSTARALLPLRTGPVRKMRSLMVVELWNEEVEKVQPKLCGFPPFSAGLPRVRLPRVQGSLILTEYGRTQYAPPKVGLFPAL
ncbi:hypothetical protein PHAMO_190022 [Magnetospirillum molischianum DSM 120]|uniref:Uncharacterized protein n=1 Tax=Magnetospirillum molischianum DSM 120 TaxID=1150626 RepID=H8FPC5_MAGML|nr:hypothetical protein PHAMO_190022 [Magnetospirillum molischianum DSM 120]